ncbi:uncharacterized protein BBOV_IV006220 [Babesia bovis T2Bo]|uniref:Membrane protein, putative n=1 Tax=Babesia bovis TaxID=5865 RepID=A7AR13_BABBO|nr:uncharacterized protein BBOV_IV006220 [Babesia bovis T2Bo]EDO06982.1 hypothetical protein BBOV_IV006220 [Babesia bovis T2Bo]|eukprot:XP_001610550.1 hypothetical protein [Babesia bovis T2Bo]
MMLLLPYLPSFYILTVIRVSLCFHKPLRRTGYLDVTFGNIRPFRCFSTSLFDKDEVDAANPPVPPPPPRIPADFVMDDVFSEHRYRNIGSYVGESSHIAALPYAEIRYQDKGSLVPYRSVEEIISCYSNKLNTLLCNFNEWTAFYNPDGKDSIDLSLYNPLSNDSYYVVVFYCAWKSESIALKRAIHQLSGRYEFVRDPPVVHGPKKKETFQEVLARLEEWERRHAEMIEDARSKGLPDPPAPPLVEREKVKMIMHSLNGAETLKILGRIQEQYNVRWWMPHIGQQKYNKVFCRAYNELYNTSYKRVRTEKSRLGYKMRNTGCQPVSVEKQKGVLGLSRVNFILVRLANSLMLSNSRRGLQRMRSAVHGHEKEMHFNEIMLKLLINLGVLYKDMPSIRIFRCSSPVDELPSVALHKSHMKIPFDSTSNFYNPDPFKIARHTLYGLPPLRKCSHLAIPSDFEYIGGIQGLSSLKDPPKIPDLLEHTERTNKSDFHRLFTPSQSNISVHSVLDPLLSTLDLVYKLNLRQIIDARPVPVTYGYLNPK